jgi:hypothetical protein
VWVQGFGDSRFLNLCSPRKNTAFCMLKCYVSGFGDEAVVDEMRRKLHEECAALEEEKAAWRRHTNVLNVGARRSASLGNIAGKPSPRCLSHTSRRSSRVV